MLYPCSLCFHIEICFCCCCFLTAYGSIYILGGTCNLFGKTSVWGFCFVSATVQFVFSKERQSPNTADHKEQKKREKHRLEKEKKEQKEREKKENEMKKKFKVS